MTRGRRFERRDDSLARYKGADYRSAAAVDVCHGLGIKTVAEFVGDQETVDLLGEIGVDFAQGYFIGKPHAVADLRSAPAG